MLVCPRPPPPPSSSLNVCGYPPYSGNAMDEKRLSDPIWVDPPMLLKAGRRSRRKEYPGGLPASMSRWVPMTAVGGGWRGSEVQLVFAGAAEESLAPSSVRASQNALCVMKLSFLQITPA